MLKRIVELCCGIESVCAYDAIVCIRMYESPLQWPRPLPAFTLSYLTPPPGLSKRIRRVWKETVSPQQMEKHYRVVSSWQNYEHCAIDGNCIEHLDQRDKSNAAVLQSSGQKYHTASLYKWISELYSQGQNKCVHYTCTFFDFLKSNTVLLQ